MRDSETWVIPVHPSVLEGWATALEDSRLDRALRGPGAPTALELVEETRRNARTQAHNAEVRRREEAEATRRRARWAALRDRRARSRERLVAANVPLRWARALSSGGYDSPDEVRRATDADLLRCRNLGPKTLSVLRLVYPYTPPPVPRWVMEE